jgi:hypothetical protein
MVPVWAFVHGWIYLFFPNGAGSHQRIAVQSQSPNANPIKIVVNGATYTISIKPYNATVPMASPHYGPLPPGQPSVFISNYPSSSSANPYVGRLDFGPNGTHVQASFQTESMPNPPVTIEIWKSP